MDFKILTKKRVIVNANLYDACDVPSENNKNKNFTIQQISSNLQAGLHYYIIRFYKIYIYKKQALVGARNLISQSIKI